MNNKQVLVYRPLDSTNDLRSVFVEHIHFKKLMKDRKFVEIFHCCMTRLWNNKYEISFKSYLFIRTALRKENMGQRNLKKPLEFHSFNEIFYCAMGRIRNTNLDVFIRCQYTRTILRKKNMGQSLFKKYSKFQNFDEIFYCGMTRFRNVKLSVFRQYQNTKTILKNKDMGQNRFIVSIKTFYFEFYVVKQGKNEWRTV